MIVYKFGGATTRTARGLDLLVSLVGQEHHHQIALSKRRTKQPVQTGLVVVVSAIGLTTRYFGRTAELAEQGEVLQSGDQLHRILHWHRQLLDALRLGETYERAVHEGFELVAKETSALIEGVAITRELSLRTRDAFLAMGEQLAFALIEALLRARGIPVGAIDARQVIVTNDDYAKASPISEEIAIRSQSLILPSLKRSEVVLTQGFVGATRDGLTTTMGGESSDLTATLLAAALDAKEVVIWKTVPGIYSADPEIVPRARLIRQLSIAEAEEIGRRGARILHPEAAHPLASMKDEITLRVASPRTVNQRSTEIRRTRQVTTRASHKVTPLVIALDQRLTLFKLRKKEANPTDRPAAPAGYRKARVAGAIPPEQALQQAIASASYSWMSPMEIHLVVKRDLKSNVMWNLRMSEFDISEQYPMSSISIVARAPSSNSSLETIRASAIKSLRSFSPLAIFPVERSIVALIGDDVAQAALRKLHRDLFGL